MADDPDAWTPDSTPFVEGYDVAEDSVPPMVGVGVPAVVAVVVTRNAGPWLETMLGSLASQEYANLTTLVVDADSVSDPTERVAKTLPNAFVKRVGEGSFAAAANAALGTIEGASFYLFCHDDIELGPGSVQAMVEEAFRSNAGIVGAKLVDWDHPEHLRSVGGSIDKFGFAWPMAEPNELDQAQHDAVREAFVVSSAAMLVRCDLFADLGGFSTDIDGAGEDLDLCWRARVAGARTVVMPAAVVRHRERSEVGDPTGRSHHLALRHQARIMAVCYTPMQLVRIAPQAFVLAIIDMIGALLRGHVSVAGDVASALGWNLLHLPRTLRIRGRVKRSRRTPDEEIRRLQIKGSVRVINFLRQRTSGNRTVAATLAAAARGLPRGRGADADGGLWPFAAFVATATVLLVGSRSLIGSGIPAVRDFVPLGSASELLREWWSGWRTPGLGAAAGAPTINLVSAVGTWLTFGSAGFVRTAMILAPLPLGAVASWRLLRGCASFPARAAALLAYLVNPLPFNAVAEGRWQGLVVYAAAPAILGRVARAGGWAPFDAAVPAPGSTQRQIVGLGVVLAVATTVAPVTALVAVLICVLVVAVLPALGVPGHPLRAIGVTAGALVLAAVLHLPWTLSVLTSSNRWSILLGADPSRRTQLSLSDAVQFDTGSHGGMVTLGLLVAAAVALLISSRDRFGWAALSAVLITASFAAVVMAGRLAPKIALPSPEVLLAVASAGVILGLALGVEAFRSDVVGGAFGWRQMLSVIAVLSVGLSSLPLVVDFVDGRWLAPKSDTDIALAPIRSKGVPNERTLWIGDADALSLQGWRLRDGMKFALTDGVRPTVSSLFPPPMGAAERELRDVLNAIGDGGTGRIGELLAPFGVRYVVIEQRLAPLPYGTTQLKIDPALDNSLNEQFDLARIEVAPGIEVYENLSRRPIRSTVAPDAPDEASAWSVTGSPPVAYSGDLPADRSLVVASARSDRWTLDVDDEERSASAVFGWASSYDVGAGGRAELHYSTPALQVLAHLLQLLVVLSLPWSRRRRISEFRVRSARSRPAPVPEVDA